MTLVEFADNVRAAVQRALADGSVTQVELAAAAGVTQGYVSLVLSGRRNAPVQVLSAIAAAAGVEVGGAVYRPSADWPRGRL